MCLMKYLQIYDQTQTLKKIIDSGKSTWDANS